MKKDAKDPESLLYEVSESFLAEYDCFSTKGELGVFSYAAVLWLGVQQRLGGNSLRSSLTALVDRIKEDTNPVNLILCPGKKIRDGELSKNTGGLSRARKRTHESLVSELVEVATRNIERKLCAEEDVYLLDVEVVRISRTKSTLEDFGSNGEDKLHFPRIRMVSAHQVQSGGAKKIAIGSWHDGEVKLATEVISGLPKGSIVAMDRFFDKPTLLAHAKECGITVVVRIREMVAKRIFGGTLPKEPCAEKAGIEPELMSFSAALDLSKAYASAFLRAKSAKERLIWGKIRDIRGVLFSALSRR